MTAPYDMFKGAYTHLFQVTGAIKRQRGFTTTHVSILATDFSSHLIADAFVRLVKSWRAHPPPYIVKFPSWFTESEPRCLLPFTTLLTGNLWTKFLPGDHGRNVCITKWCHVELAKRWMGLWGLRLTIYQAGALWLACASTASRSVCLLAKVNVLALTVL